MNIWVDADACPVVIKEVIFRAAERTKISTTLVANHSMRVPKSPFIKFVQVSSGFDIADDEIVKRVQANDLVITSDIPLAAEVIENDVNGYLISPDDPEQFTKVLGKVILNREQVVEMGRRAKKHYQDGFTLERFQNDWRELHLSQS